MKKYKRFLVDLKPQEYYSIDNILKQYNIKKSEIIRYVINEINSPYSFILNGTLNNKNKSYYEERKKILYKK